ELPGGAHVPLERAHVGAKRDLYACLQRTAERVLLNLQTGRFLRLSARAFGPPLGVVLGDVGGRYKPDALGHHRPPVFRREVVAVLDRVDAGFNRVVPAQQAGSMRRYKAAFTVGFVDDGAEFVEGERWNRVEDVVMNPATTVGIDLDPIDAMRNLF